MRKQRARDQVQYLLCVARKTYPSTRDRGRDVFNNKRRRLGQAMIYVSIEGEFGNSWPTDRRICIQTSPLRPHIRNTQHPLAISLSNGGGGSSLPKWPNWISAVVIAHCQLHTDTRAQALLGSLSQTQTHMQIASQLTALFLSRVFVLLLLESDVWV